MYLETGHTSLPLTMLLNYFWGEAVLGFELMASLVSTLPLEPHPQSFLL
jgi:hypothetical protein